MGPVALGRCDGWFLGWKGGQVCLGCFALFTIKDSIASLGLSLGFREDYTIFFFSLLVRLVALIQCLLCIRHGQRSVLVCEELGQINAMSMPFSQDIANGINRTWRMA